MLLRPSTATDILFLFLFFTCVHPTGPCWRPKRGYSAKSETYIQLTHIRNRCQHLSKPVTSVRSRRVVACVLVEVMAGFGVGCENHTGGRQSVGALA